jgi:predicted TIM-barrel fold metal-dependent hydrolase
VPANDRSALMDQVRAGQPLLDTLVIDCHCHLGEWRGFHVPEANADGMLKSMDALGIDTACLTAHAAIGPDFRLGNRMVRDAVMNHPGRFLGYVTLNPHYEEDMQTEIEECFAFGGFRGIKLHPGLHGVSPDDRRYERAFRAANEKRCPVLVHTWGAADLQAVESVAGKYTDAQFIMAHAGGSVAAMETAVEIVNRNANVYIDTAFSLAYEGNVEWLTEEVGSEKILFGSDMPFFDPRIDFGRVVWAGILESDKKNILGLNMKRLLAAR